MPLLSEGAFGPLAATVHAGEISIWLAFILAWAATTVGNTVGFLAFSTYGPGLTAWLSRRWPKFSATRAQLEPRVRKHMYLVTGVSRFVGLGTFSIILWLSGLVGTPWTRFLPFIGILNLFWTAIWLFGSTWLVQELLPLMEGRAVWKLVVLGAIALVAVWIGHLVIRRLANWRRNHQSPG